MEPDSPSRFAPKNSSSPGKILRCRVVSTPLPTEQGDDSHPEFQLQCDCLGDDPAVVNRKKMEDALARKKALHHTDANSGGQSEDLDEKSPAGEAKTVGEKDPEINRQEVAQARSLIAQLLERRQSRQVRKGIVTRFPARASTPDSRRRLPKWVELEDGILVYKFNVFNTDPERVDQKLLESLVRAVEKDSKETYAGDYGCRAVFDLYAAEGLKRKELFQGERMAIFVGEYGQGAFHYVNTPEPVNTYSFPVGGGKLAGYKIDLPAGSNFDYVPYSVISSDSVPDFIGGPKNIYAISQSTLPAAANQDVYHQIVATALSHEVKEIIQNDDTLRWIMFDHYAPTVANWRWGEFKDPSNEYHCTNSKPTSTKDPQTGEKYYELPLFLKKFPTGGLFFAVHEVGDVVSAGFAALYNSYLVDGWLIQNHPLPNFWRPYNSSPELKYDHLGHVQYPMEPNGGLHQLIFFISFDDARVRLLEVQNKGPVTASMRGANPNNNFPPEYVVVRQLQEIVADMNVMSLIEALENYGPSTPDRT
jgi:hypothetical protein